jgi:hypothetical protein
MAENATPSQSEGAKAPDLGEVQGHSGAVVAKTAKILPLAQRAISPLSPEARAVCGNSARTALYGGCLVRGIPTVTFLSPWAV